MVPGSTNCSVFPGNDPAFEPSLRQHQSPMSGKRDIAGQRRRRRDVARLKALRIRTLLQERELLTAQKIVDDEPAHIATLDERLAAAADWPCEAGADLYFSLQPSPSLT
jgi:hypothetical protein